MREATLTALRFAGLPRAAHLRPAGARAAGSRSTARSRAARKGCSAPPPAAPRRTSSAWPRSTPRSTAAEQIALAHLEAALAVWRYSLDSARWIFGDSLGDPTADEIWALAKDRPQGVTRSEVRDLFSRNKKAREIDRALTVLEEAGRLTRTSQADGRGRPAERWLPRAA